MRSAAVLAAETSLVVTLALPTRLIPRPLLRSSSADDAASLWKQWRDLQETSSCPRAVQSCWSLKLEETGSAHHHHHDHDFQQRFEHRELGQRDHQLRTSELHPRARHLCRRPCCCQHHHDHCKIALALQSRETIQCQAADAGVHLGHQEERFGPEDGEAGDLGRHPYPSKLVTDSTDVPETLLLHPFLRLLSSACPSLDARDPGSQEPYRRQHPAPCLVNERTDTWKRPESCARTDGQPNDHDPIREEETDDLGSDPLLAVVCGSTATLQALVSSGKRKRQQEAAKADHDAHPNKRAGDLDGRRTSVPLPRILLPLTRVFTGTSGPTRTHAPVNQAVKGSSAHQ